MNLYSKEVRDRAISLLILLGWKRHDETLLLHPKSFNVDNEIYIDNETNVFYFCKTNIKIKKGDTIYLEDKKDIMSYHGQLVIDIVLEHTDNEARTIS